MRILNPHDMHYLAGYYVLHTYCGLINPLRPDRLLRRREELLRRRVGVDEAEHMVHRRGDFVRRRQAAPLLHLRRIGNAQVSHTDEKGNACANG